MPLFAQSATNKSGRAHPDVTAFPWPRPKANHDQKEVITIMCSVSSQNRAALYENGSSLGEGVHLISAQQLFQEHAMHITLCRLLKESIAKAEEEQRQWIGNPAAAIEAASLRRAPIGNIPRSPTQGSPTERVVIIMDEMLAEDALEQKRKKLHRIEAYLRLYESLLPLFTAKERWFIEQHFQQQRPMAQLTCLPGSPFEGYDRSTVVRFKQRLFAKADNVLKQVYAHEE